MFDDDTDLVLWGHEHDCRIVPEPVADKQYHISQPGSSVATSLAEGEALEKFVYMLTTPIFACDLLIIATALPPYRKVGLLHIHGKTFRMEPIPLKTVRPFVIKQLEMADAAEEEGVDLNNKAKVNEYLRKKVSVFLVFSCHMTNLTRLTISRSPGPRVHRRGQRSLGR